jgi:Fe-S-cluster containining protein
MDSEAEKDPDVARANSLANRSAVLEHFPPALAEREASLRSEIAAVPGSPAKKLRALDGAMDIFSAAIAPHAACRRACSGCCHIKVDIFPIEAQLIAAWTGRVRLPRLLPPADFHGTPCPFLVQDSCSIYEHRPFACRNHYAFTKTAYWCQPERSNGQSFSFVRLSEVDAAFADIISQDGRLEPHDIRQAFLVRTETDGR